MTKLLVSRDKPDGFTTEDVLGTVRSDIIIRMNAYLDDPRREVRSVLDNNVKILGLLTEAMHLAEENTKKLVE